MVYDEVTTEGGETMMTVKEVSELAGVSIRALRYYDKLGLLPASAYTESGYRLYDDAALERLQQILLFRELEFPLKDIRRILDSPDFDKDKALAQQIEFLEMKGRHIDQLITFARRLKLTGGRYMEFEAFDKKTLEDYTRQARESWGKTDAYKEFEEKNSGRTLGELQSLGQTLMGIVAEFGSLQTLPAADPAVQAQVQKLRDFITEHYYTCTREILALLGQMYASGDEFTRNINAAGGPGAAEFAGEAIRVYCET